MMDLSASPSKKPSGSFNIFEDHGAQKHILKRNSGIIPVPLTTSKLANQIPGHDCQKKTKSDTDQSAVNQLLARLTQQEDVQACQKHQFNENDEDASSSSATDPYANNASTESIVNTNGHQDPNEIFRLREELAVTKKQMADMSMEVTRSRMAVYTVGEAISSPFSATQPLAFNLDGLDTVPTQGGLHSRIGPLHPLNQHIPGLGAPMPPDTRAHQPGGHFLTAHDADPYPLLSRPTSGFGVRSGYHTAFTPPVTPIGFQAPYALPNGIAANQQPPIGTRPTPSIAEFPTAVQPGWNGPLTQNNTTYVSTTEPLNYRRLLDRSVSCNWKYIVDKIVCNNDQQASIFLQQKLKVGTTDQKFEIVQAIIDQAYALMVNRFGNFLVQRCFEHGTPEQVVCIAQAIRGNTLNLSMDAFGCHVIQKAFDCVPEEYKAIMVHELLRRIPETVIHRYACHVWQKLFELRWSDSPPQIMKYVNEALRGMWHEVALGETGSLVVQNIFENCLEEDKRPCINEVLANIDVVAHGQFGNWCIQHICEHGAIPDCTRAVDHVLRFGPEYSMDQFASKVVEKCLKIGGTEFLDRYLDRVCESRPGRPRMPLIDISGDQFGNYLIQYILTNSDPQRRETVATHIRKHMVSLRGSKYGSRVAMLCSNPAFATRPGPPAGLPLSRNSNNYGDRFGSDMPTRAYSNDRPYVGTGRGGYGASYR